MTPVFGNGPVEDLAHALAHTRCRFVLRRPDGLQNAQYVGLGNIGNPAVTQFRKDIGSQRIDPLIGMLWVLLCRKLKLVHLAGKLFKGVDPALTPPLC